MQQRRCTLKISTRVEALQAIFGERECRDFDLAVDLIGDNLDLGSAEKMELDTLNDSTLVNLNEFKEDPENFIEEEYDIDTGYNPYLIKLARLIGLTFITLHEEVIAHTDKLLQHVSTIKDTANPMDFDSSSGEETELDDAEQETAASSMAVDGSDDDNLYPVNELNPPDAVSLDHENDFVVLDTESNQDQPTDVMVEEVADDHAGLLESLNSGFVRPNLGHDEQESLPEDFQDQEALENPAKEDDSHNSVQPESNITSNSVFSNVSKNVVPDLFFPVAGTMSQSEELSTQNTRAITEHAWWISRKQSIEHAVRIVRDEKCVFEAIGGKSDLNIWQEYMSECSQGYYSPINIERGHLGNALIQALLSKMDILDPNEYIERFGS